MVCIHDAEGQCDEHAIVKLPKYALALCAPKRGRDLGVDRQMLSISVADKTGCLLQETLNKDGVVVKSSPHLTAHDVIIDGTFPDWRRVTPQGDFEPMGLSSLNPKYMGELARFSESLGKSGSSKGAMYFLRRKDASEGDPVVVRFSGLHHVFAVLMPMRADPVLALPEFFGTTEPEALKAA
jgi:hypothetical protein